MANKISLVSYYKFIKADTPGSGAKFFAVFRAARVNLLAVHAFPSGKRRVQVDVVPANETAFGRAARKAKLKLGKKKKAFLIEGDDRIGILAQILETVGDAGVNVTAVTALRAGKGRYGAIFWVKEKDLRRTRRVLRV